MYTVSKNHIFYQNPKENSNKPPWFIDCDRSEAEEILKNFQQFGNVLIRKNSSFPVNGSYALSAATKLNGEVKYVHYQISRTPTGFKLEVQSKPAPMPCLHEVLEYYIKAAGFNDHRSFIIDPKGVKDEKKYVDMSNTKNLKKEHDYLPMTGKRRGSAPPATQEYVTASQKQGGEGQEYVNVNGAKHRSSVPLARSMSNNDNDVQRFGKNNHAPLCRVPPLPNEPIYLEPLKDADTDDDLDN